MTIGARSWEQGEDATKAGTLLDGMKALLGQLAGTAPAQLEAQMDGARCLRIVGRLDKRVARAVKGQAREFVSQAQAPWTIDLAGVTAWDSEGLAALVYALDVSELNGHPLTLLDPSPKLRFTLEKAQLHHLFTIAQRS